MSGNLSPYSMALNEDKKRIIVANFLRHCEKIGFSDPQHPIEVDIVDGVPIGMRAYRQSVRFDILTKTPQNTTMD